MMALIMISYPILSSIPISLPPYSRDCPLGNGDNVSGVILEHDDIARDGFAIVHVCEDGLVDRVHPGMSARIL